MKDVKVGILTHFTSFNPGYALHVGWLERAKMLQYFGVNFDFLLSIKNKSDVYPRSKKILPKVRRWNKRSVKGH